MLAGPAGKLIFISAFNTLLAIITAVSAVSILPNLELFNDEAKDWQACKTYEKSCNSFLDNNEGQFDEDTVNQFGCDENQLNCVDPSSRPAVGTMGLFYVCTPLSFFMVALVYTTNASTRKFLFKLVSRTTIFSSSKSLKSNKVAGSDVSSVAVSPVACEE